MKENKLEEMRTLIEKLQIASSAYYNKQPIMNNYEYDLKCKQLIALEKETGITYPDSPTLKVGAAIEKQSSLTPVKHEYPTRSLDKTQDIKKYIGQLSKGVTGSGKMKSYSCGNLTVAPFRQHMKTESLFFLQHEVMEKPAMTLRLMHLI